MKTTTLFISFLVLISFKVHAQKEYTNWRFGNRAGIAFSNGAEPVNFSDMTSLEGCATISDNNGNLLFYTNGVEVWNNNNDIMPNGSGLLGDVSTSQSSLIIKKPGSSSIYYIFTLDKRGYDSGLNYSEVNMSLDVGLGDVTTNKNIQIEQGPLTEKMTFTRHGNGTDFWVIVHKLNSSEFLAYQVSSSGVSLTPVVSDPGAIYSTYYGTMKISSSYDRMASTNGKTVEILDFNNATGIFSNPISTYNLTNALNYGIEFSPNGQFLYVSDVINPEENSGLTDSSVYQLDISSNVISTISNSKQIIQLSSLYSYGSIQMAINGNIYIAKTLEKDLDVIDDPDNLGVECHYIENGITLNNKVSNYGLPQIIPSNKLLDMNVYIDCSSYETIFSIDFDEPIDDLIWDFGDGETSTQENVSHIYTSAGIYKVTLTVNSGSFCKTIESRVVIPGFPNTDNIPNLEICDDESNDGVGVFDLASHSEAIIPEDTGSYVFSYHLNETEAQNNINPLGDLYENTTNYQELFVRLEAVGNSDCFVVGSFLLIVNQFGTFENNEGEITISTQDGTQQNNSITINVEGGGIYLYSLNGIDYQSNPFFSNLGTGIYTVYIKDFSKCGVFKKKIPILDYPSFFTPNGDNIHDFWKIKFSEFEPDMEIFIFDRYGKLIKNLHPTSYGWDGNLKGEKLPESDYWFKVNRPSRGFQHTGHFTLKR